MLSIRRELYKSVAGRNHFSSITTAVWSKYLFRIFSICYGGILAHENCKFGAEERVSRLEGRGIILLEKICAPFAGQVIKSYCSFLTSSAYTENLRKTVSDLIRQQDSFATTLSFHQRSVFASQDCQPVQNIAFFLK